MKTNAKSKPRKLSIAEMTHGSLAQLRDELEKDMENIPPAMRETKLLHAIFKVQVLNTQILAELAEKQGVKLG